MPLGVDHYVFTIAITFPGWESLALVSCSPSSGEGRVVWMRGGSGVLKKQWRESRPVSMMVMISSSEG